MTPRDLMPKLSNRFWSESEEKLIIERPESEPLLQVVYFRDAVIISKIISVSMTVVKIHFAFILVIIQKNYSFLCGL